MTSLGMRSLSPPRSSAAATAWHVTRQDAMPRSAAQPDAGADQRGQAHASRVRDRGLSLPGGAVAEDNLREVAGAEHAYAAVLGNGCRTCTFTCCRGFLAPRSSTGDAREPVAAGPARQDEGHRGPGSRATTLSPRQRSLIA